MAHTVKIINGKQPSGGNGGVTDADLSNIAVNFFTKGIAKKDDYKGEQQATPNMTVKINTGIAYIPNAAGTMLYVTELDAPVNVSIGSNASGNPRIDAIVIKIDMGTIPNNFANNIASFAAIAGSPAASPSAPTDSAIQTAIGAGNNFYRLDNVTVPNGASSISNANIADMRAGVQLKVLGGYLRYNIASGKLQFSHDGSTYNDLGSQDVRRQDDTSNSILAAPKVQTGWGYTLQPVSTAPSWTSKTVTFPTAFTGTPIVIMIYAGSKISTAPTDLNQVTQREKPVYTSTINITTTGFSANIYPDFTPGADEYLAFTWIAIGS